MVKAKILVEFETEKAEETYHVLDRIVKAIHKNCYGVKAYWDGDDIES